ncbi:DUF5107 domain-containing protein [candidate division KSB1 bacterium]|nr:DUF5107 domain-containing protein [candidate division KSB1 bacterium]
MTILLLNPLSEFCFSASVSEKQVPMITYPFYDPDPIPALGKIYPCFHFDGFTKKGSIQNCKMVEMENDYIKLSITPDIGEKIWGAIEKSTDREFIYHNPVIKFRDIAMRGPWTFGGIEFNFGTIGHLPTCSTPVDYLLMDQLSTNNKEMPLQWCRAICDGDLLRVKKLSAEIDPDNRMIVYITRFFDLLIDTRNYVPNRKEQK